jgi:1,2-phenylacetyl-CoA epoxidase catalytic subunit
MAASLVENGAIDRKMFQDSTSEYLVVFTKIEPVLAAIRAGYTPTFLQHLEKLTLSLPDARKQIDEMSARMKKLIEVRKAAATTA